MPTIIDDTYKRVPIPGFVRPPSWLGDIAHEC